MNFILFWVSILSFPPSLPKILQFNMVSKWYQRYHPPRLVCHYSTAEFPTICNTATSPTAVDAFDSPTTPWSTSGQIFSICDLSWQVHLLAHVRYIVVFLFGHCTLTHGYLTPFLDTFAIHLPCCTISDQAQPPLPLFATSSHGCTALLGYVLSCLTLRSSVLILPSSDLSCFHCAWATSWLS